MSITYISGTTNIRHIGNPSQVILESSVTEYLHKIIIAFGTTLMRWALYVDDNNQVVFDVAKFSKFIFAQWENDFPNTINPDFYDCAQNFKTIPISAQDVYTGSAEAAVSIGTYKFINGGISYENFNAIDFWDTYFPANAPALPFLTWRNKSLKKYTTPDAIEFLTYLVSNAAHTAINAKIKAWDYAETEITTDTIPLSASFTGGLNKLIRFGCGLGNVDYSSLGFAETDVKFFDIWLEDDIEGVISEVRRYYVDRKYYKHNHQFVYFNALAGIDTVIMHAEINQQQDSTRTILSRYVPPAYNPVAGNKIAANINSSCSFKVAYYPESNYEKLLMQDMMLSPKIAKYENGMLKPIIITSSKISLGNDKDTNPYIEFEYIYAFDNNFFTPQL